LLSRQFDFDGNALGKAIGATFEHRRTEIPVAIVALSENFAEAKQIQWRAFRQRLQQEYVPETLAEIVPDLKAFLEPVANAIRSGKAPPKTWKASGPWTELP
jgi:hypothetical protein